MAYFTKPEEVLDYIHDLLETKEGELGLQYVAYGNEEMLPRYPAVRVASGLFEKELHATRQWRNTFRVELYVYHGKLTATHAHRSKADLELASAVREVLHDDMTLSNQIVHGWVTAEGNAQIARKTTVIVGTRMAWEGQALESFNM